MNLELRDDGLLVVDEPVGNRFHSRGSFGTPQSGGSLLLTAVEALFLEQEGRLKLRDRYVRELDAFVHPSGRPVAAVLRVYTELRTRGLLTKEQEDGSLLVWERTKGLQDEPWIRVHVRTEAEPMVRDDVLVPDGDVLAIVDVDHHVLFYSLHVPQFEGTNPTLQDDVDAEELRLSTPPSVLEQAWLDGQATTDVERVFVSLRNEGLLVKTGFRFGTHLRAYEGEMGEGHAPWLLHVWAQDESPHWSLISRGVRLSHGVRKDFVLAMVDGETIQYRSLRWLRP